MYFESLNANSLIVKARKEAKINLGGKRGYITLSRINYLVINKKEKSLQVINSFTFLIYTICEDKVTPTKVFMLNDAFNKLMEEIDFDGKFPSKRFVHVKNPKKTVYERLS